MLKVKSTVGGMFSLTFEKSSTTVASGKMLDLDLYCSRTWLASDNPNAVFIRKCFEIGHLIVVFDSAVALPSAPIKKVRIIKNAEVPTTLAPLPSPAPIKPILGPLGVKKSAPKAKKKKEVVVEDFGTDPLDEPVEEVVEEVVKEVVDESEPILTIDPADPVEAASTLDAMSYKNIRKLAKELGIVSYGKTLKTLRDEILAAQQE